MVARPFGFFLHFTWHLVIPALAIAKPLAVTHARRAKATALNGLHRIVAQHDLE